MLSDHILFVLILIDVMLSLAPQAVRFYKRFLH